MKAKHSFIDYEIVSIKGDCIDYYWEHNLSYCHWEGQITCIFKRWDNVSNVFVDLATINFKGNGQSKSLNIPLEHLSKKKSISSTREKFISLMVRLTEEEKYYLLAESYFHF